jgi:DNA-binding MarR family transcriptional regulator
VDALYTQFDAVFFERTRLSIMTLLFREKRSSFNRLKQALDLTDGAASSHIKKLSEAGYVDSRRTLSGDRVQTLYSLTAQGQTVFRHYLTFLQSLAQEGSDE